MGVFSKNKGPEEKIKRNPFDMSFHNNLTMKMGYLYPCFCKEVIPGDSVKIDSALGLRFMPTAFPLQTKVKAYVDFFYVRNRTLWKDYENYLFGTGQPSSFPVMSKSQLKKLAKTCELGDYLGLPTTLIGGSVASRASYTTYDNHGAGFNLVMEDFSPVLRLVNSSKFHNYGMWLRSDNIADGNAYTVDRSTLLAQPTEEIPFNAGISYKETCYKLPISVTSDQAKWISSHVVSVSRENLSSPKEQRTVQISPFSITGRLTHGTSAVNVKTIVPFSQNREYYVPTVVYNQSTGSLLVTESYLNSNEYDKFTVCFSPFDYDPTSNSDSPFSGIQSPIKLSDIIIPPTTSTGVSEFQDSFEFPFDISALPFRAYEQIYNAFYRDNRNNPYIVNGVEDPNVFLPTTDGGVDDNDYVLHKRNYEQDFLTTAMISPQYGDAPLVGVSASGVASFRDSDGNIIRTQLTTDESGDKIVSFETTNNQQVNRSLVQLASEGFSINTLRGVNALQRFLETNYRRGLRYKDQLQAHFGVDVAYNILDMPEYIGGYIIGIVSVVPVPTYSQLMPKHFLKTNEPLDFYFPAFAHLGMQPVKYNEVCPCQAVAEDVSTNEVFGYQRAWYDYLASTDEVHGLFRTSLSSFVLARVYDSVPSLNEKFLTVDPSNLNDVFTVNEVDGEPIDPILGQIHFDATFMRPIPRYNNPSLE